jgi:hypothetical protein
MNRRQVACGIADGFVSDAEFSVRVVGLADGAVVLLRGMEEAAFKVLAECQEESEEAAIGWSKDKAVWCVVCPERAGFAAAQCRVAEELHLFDGLASPLAKDAGVRVEDREETLEEFAEGQGISGQ